MTKKNFLLKFLLISTSLIVSHSDAKLTDDNFSDIRPLLEASFKDDGKACDQRIAEEMCNGRMDTTPTPQAILKFIDAIASYINKLKDTHNISDETVNIAKIAVLDAAIARKMLSLRTPADIIMDIEHKIKNVDRKVLELEKHLRHHKKKS